MPFHWRGCGRPGLGNADVRELRRRKRGGQRHHRPVYDRPRHGDMPHRPQFVKLKMKSDAEHQQDHAKFGQILDGNIEDLVLSAKDTPAQQIKCCWAKQQANQNCAEDRWLPQAHAERSSSFCTENNNQQQ